MSVSMPSAGVCSSVSAGVAVAVLDCAAPAVSDPVSVPRQDAGAGSKERHGMLLDHTLHQVCLCLMLTYLKKRPRESHPMVRPHCRCVGEVMHKFRTTFQEKPADDVTHHK